MLERSRYTRLSAQSFDAGGTDVKVRNQVPSTGEEWMREIGRAYADANEALYFAPGADPKGLHVTASLVMLKFRGIPRGKEVLKKTPRDRPRFGTLQDDLGRPELVAVLDGAA